MKTLPARPCLVVLLLLLLPGTMTTWSCNGDDGASDAGVADAGPSGDLAPQDLGPEDTGCPWYPYPSCGTNRYAVQDPPPEGCEDGPWHCEDCPDPTQFPPCPPGQSHQPEPETGCLSAVVCDCSITEPPDCEEGTVPQYYGEVDGKCCLTGACGVDCPRVDPPECSIYEQQQRDERGCLTGFCERIPCPPVEVPDCLCQQRPGRNPAGCFTGACEEEPDACTVREIPDCPDGKVPELAQMGGCLTGRCVIGSCIDRCENDWDCASSDACMGYAPGCRACFPKPCGDFRDCPFYTDCINERCRLRTEADSSCEKDEDCPEWLICDSPTCGACEPPCECIRHQDCERGTRCVDCACVEGCQDDEDCVLPQHCNSETGVCEDCECEEHAQCPDGEFCTGCFCRPGCRLDGECPPWHVCGQVDHRCVPDVQCTRSGQCADNQRCVDGRCIPDPGLCDEGMGLCEPYFDDCSCDFICILPEDRPLSCNRDCGDAEFEAPPMCLCEFGECSFGACDGASEATCPAPYHCSKRRPGNVLDGGICREGRPPERQLCREDQDCVPEECCRPTLCVHQDMAACESPVDCEDEACRLPITGCRCVEGVCVTDYQRDACQ